MRIGRASFALVLICCLGCQSVFNDTSSRTGTSAELCNTPGRRRFADQITARGGQLVSSETDTWDNTVDASTKEKMGPPLSKVVLPQDVFSAQDVRTAQNLFPEAQVSAPLTLDSSEESEPE